MLYLRDLGDTEVGFFAQSHPDHPLYVIELHMIKQVCSSVSVDFDDDDIANYTDEMVAAGLKPAEFLRIWCHTHPGNSPSPSGTDENTFRDCFEHCDWSVMFIIAKDNSTYARLKVRVDSPNSVRNLPIKLDEHREFTLPVGIEYLPEPDQAKSWQEQYHRYVEKEVWHSPTSRHRGSTSWPSHSQSGGTSGHYGQHNKSADDAWDDYLLPSAYKSDSKPSTAAGFIDDKTGAIVVSEPNEPEAFDWDQYREAKEKLETETGIPADSAAAEKTAWEHYMDNLPG